MKTKSLLMALLVLAPCSQPAFAQSRDYQGYQPESAPPSSAQVAVTLKPLGAVIDQSSHAAMWFSLGADLGTTWYGIKKDHAHELNPALRGSMVKLSATAIGITAFADWANHRLGESHPTMASIIRIGLTSVHLGAVVHNLR